jgi:hypothetical protein
MGGGFAPTPGGALSPTVFHIGNFPLPDGGATFGADAVTLMGSNDVLIVVVEYGSENADTPPFAAQGIPSALQARQFDRSALQRGVPGQSGLQQFFSVKGRAFCLYVVLGSHIDRFDLVPQVNQVLDTLEID